MHALQQRAGVPMRCAARAPLRRPSTTLATAEPWGGATPRVPTPVSGAPRAGPPRRAVLRCAAGVRQPPRRAAGRCAAGPPDRNFGEEAEADDFFDVLGVTPADGPEVVRDAFRRLQKQYHPDRAGDSTAAVARSAALNVAFETLMDPARRNAYLGRRTGARAGARRGARNGGGAAQRREGLVGPLRQERLLATLLPRSSYGTQRMTGEEVRDSVREWAKTLAFGCELPLPLPLQVDDLPEGVRIAMLRLAPGGGLTPVGELVFSIEATEECDVSDDGAELKAMRTCDWRATVARRWPLDSGIDGPLPGETRILEALRREFDHLIAVGDGKTRFGGIEVPGWLTAVTAWALPALPLFGASSGPAGGAYGAYQLQRSCRLAADGRRPQTGR